jgi:hypothetical protein
VGLVLFALRPVGRLLLVVLVTSLLPYAFTWRIPAAPSGASRCTSTRCTAGGSARDRDRRIVRRSARQAPRLVEPGPRGAGSATASSSP